MGTKQKLPDTATTTDLHVQGMDCATCVVRVQKALLKVPGVENASVNLTDESARVVHESSVDVASLLSAVGKSGYGATLADSHSHFAQADESLTPLVLAVLGAAVAVGMDFLVNARPLPLTFLLAILSTVVVFYSGRAIWKGAISAIKSRELGMDVLIALGAGAAYVAGFIEWSQNPSGMSDFGTAAAIIAFQLIGRRIEARARRRLGSAMAALIAISPKVASRLAASGEYESISVDHLQVGDIVKISPGDLIPGDGEVESGESAVDESTLTGESLPIDKKRGDRVFEGSVNVSGFLIAKIDRTGKGATLNRIVEAVRHAQASRAPVQRIADRIVTWFVPLVILLSAASFIGYMVATGDWHKAMFVAVTVLVVACPCPLGLAAPAAISVAGGEAAKRGILFRDAEAIEAAAQVVRVVLDKTGTVTEGKPEVSNFTAFGDSENEALQLFASAEFGSEHPLGRAIVAYSQSRGIPVSAPDSFVARGGRGLEATVGSRKVIVGSIAFLEPLNLTNAAELSVWAQKEQVEGATVVALAIEGKVVAAAALKDRLRAGAKAAVSSLKLSGYIPVLLTGDAEAPANSVARELGIDDVKSGVLPEGKSEYIENLVKSGPVAMIGDGVNDAPALARATLGVSIGGGSDVAIGASSVTLMRGNIEAAPQMLRLAKATIANIRLSFLWAFVYNVVMAPIAISGMLNPMLASALMALSDIVVIGNALRLKRFRF